MPLSFVRKKIKLITFSGFSENNPLRKIGKFNIHVKSNIYNVVESVHLIILLYSRSDLKLITFDRT